MKKGITLLLCIVMFLTILPAATAETVLPEQTANEISSALLAANQWYESYQEELTAWDVIALLASGFSDKRVENIVGSSVWTQNAAVYIAAGDISKLSLHTIALLAAGRNPDSVAAVLKKSPVDVIAESQTEDGSFGSSGYLNESIYAIIALENTRPNTYNRNTAKQYLISQQCADGGYTFFGDTGDVDMTSMALLALSFYRGDAAIDAAIDRAVSFLIDNLTENGGYIPVWSSNGAENSNSVSAAISGLLAVGGERVFASEKYPLMVQNLLTFAREDGGFAYEATETESNYFATNQALITLSDLGFHEMSWVHRLAWNDTITDVLARYSDHDKIAKWAEGYVTSATQENLFRGNADGTFNPRGTLTRAELATVLARIAGLNTNVDAHHADVNNQAWYAGALTAAIDAGYLTAENNKARPNSPATRSEVAYAVTVLCDLNSDVGYVQAVIDSGIMVGDPDGDFRANDSIRREEAAKVLLLASKHRR